MTMCMDVMMIVNVSSPDLPWELHWSKSMIVSDLNTVPVVYYIAYVNGEISQLNHH